MIDVILEARRLAAETIKHLDCGYYYGWKDLKEVECTLNGAAQILDRIGHYEAVQVLSRLVADLPSPNCRENDVGDYEMRELRAQLARLKEEIEKQEEEIDRQESVTT
ncbi:hypothetical protein [Thiocapsa rosea]|uniref:Uncharacterized protein n=1 Tax=Thiocapsa rosea TaxID=69360 RepID=A0A495UKR6_9GAMM|nr:hypothetical protein [Thiocapsa rosea]RKT37894.1 hypothetical protein BDD21_5405 [Thiocapsa rosea]